MWYILIVSPYFGSVTWEITTCTWLEVAEFLSKEPPTGDSLGSITRADYLCSQRGRELTRMEQDLGFTDLGLIIQFLRKYLRKGKISGKKM